MAAVSNTTFDVYQGLPFDMKWEVAKKLNFQDFLSFSQSTVENREIANTIANGQIFALIGKTAFENLADNDKGVHKLINCFKGLFSHFSNIKQLSINHLDVNKLHFPYAENLKKMMNVFTCFWQNQTNIGHLHTRLPDADVEITKIICNSRLKLHEKASGLQTLIHEKKEHFLNLKEFDLSNGKLLGIFPEIKHFKNLKTLNLQGNQLKEIPEEIQKLENLQEINLKNNPGISEKTIPEEMKKKENLTVHVDSPTEENSKAAVDSPDKKGL